MIAGSRNLVLALGVPRAACQPRQVDRKPQAARLGHAWDQDHAWDQASCRPPGVRAPDGSAPSLWSSERWLAG